MPEISSGNLKQDQMPFMQKSPVKEELKKDEVKSHPEEFEEIFGSRQQTNKKVI
jgi:uncharacterized protein YicC (UPF0701 family)